MAVSGYGKLIFFLYLADKINIMTDQNESNIFHLEVDEIAKSHMLEMGRWGKFLSIIGFIMIGLMLLGGIFISLAMSSISSGMLGGMSGMAFFFIYLIIAGIIFYPTYALFRFSTNIKPALNMMNRAQFNTAFGNLRGMFKYWGIMTIVMLGFYLLVIIIFGLGISAFR